MKLIEIYKFKSLKGQAGKRFIKVVVEGNTIRRVFEPDPPVDIINSTLYILGKPIYSWSDPDIEWGYWLGKPMFGGNMRKWAMIKNAVCNYKTYLNKIRKRG